MASNSVFVRQLYQTILARDPDAASSSWTNVLDTGFFTRAQVVHNFLTSAEYEQGVETIGRLYYAVNKQTLDLASLQTWMNIYRQGATLEQLAGQFIGASSTFKAVNSLGNAGQVVDFLYQNVFGRAADAGGKGMWTAALENGGSVGGVLAAFAGSAEFQQKADLTLANNMAYYAFAGRQPSATELLSMPQNLVDITVMAASKGTVDSGVSGLTYSTVSLSESAANNGSVSTVVTIVLSGDTFAGKIGATLGKLTGVPSGLTAVLTKTTDTTATLMLTGAAKSHGVADTTNAMSLVFSTSDFTSASIAGKTGIAQPFSVSFFEMPLMETNGSLTINGTITNALTVDLNTDKVLFGTAAATLSSGSMANVKNVDLQGVQGTKVSVSVVGDDADNVFQASKLGGTLTGGKGADSLYLNSGTDTVVFASTAAENGSDVIYGFKPGTGGDVLNFSAFLNKTGTGHIKAVSQLSTDNAAWTNGDVLVAVGNGLDTPQAVAGLFAALPLPATAPFAQPSVAAGSAPAKAVLITADIVGDARIWYVVNQTGTSVIDSSEITLVGVLKDVNNLALSGYGFVAGNFA